MAQIQIEEEPQHHHVAHIQVTVLGQEGDSKTVTTSEHQTCQHLLHEGLRALYGEPTPPAHEYDLVFSGKIVEPLSQTLAHAKITNHSTVTILPQRISRG